MTTVFCVLTPQLYQFPPFSLFHLEQITPHEVKPQSEIVTDYNDDTNNKISKNLFTYPSSGSKTELEYLIFFLKVMEEMTLLDGVHSIALMLWQRTSQRKSSIWKQLTRGRWSENL